MLDRKNYPVEAVVLGVPNADANPREEAGAAAACVGAGEEAAGVPNPKAEIKICMYRIST